MIISILAANHNKKVWGEDASVWKPERWMDTIDGEKYVWGTESGKFPAEGVKGASAVKYPGVYGQMYDAYRLFLCMDECSRTDLVRQDDLPRWG